MITCVWQTAQEWADLFAQDVSMFDGVTGHAGDTYTRVCADGTVWINEVLAYTMQGVLP
jgi:hypothetical protein